MSKNFVVNSVSLKSVFAENEEHPAHYSQLDRTSDHCHWSHRSCVLGQCH